MSTAPEWVTMRAEPARSIGKRVLAVEGMRDAQVYAAWLQKLVAAETLAEDKVVTVSTEGKAQLLAGLKWYRQEGGNPADVFGLRDRDEWDLARIETELAALPQLRVNAHRHCLESYFCDPAELRTALARSLIPNGGRAAKSTEVAARLGLANWVGHWALWTTLERVKNSMSDAAYPDAFHHGIASPPDKVVKAKLSEWAAMIDVARIMRDYRALRKSARRRPTPEQFASCIYAKNVFSQVVLVELNNLKAGIESDEWMPQLAGWLPEVPADIRVILEPLVV
jgi:hypothetical protein